jgi:hypothetical protein
MLDNMTPANIETIIDAVLGALEDPLTDAQKAALAAFRAGDADRLRWLAASNLGCSYCRSLGYLISAKLKPDLPTVAVILAEASRAAADYRRDQVMEYLGAVIESEVREGAMAIA